MFAAAFVERITNPHHSGLKLPQQKAATAGKAVKRLPPPERLIVSLWQHAGKPCSPLVQKGDRVIRGQKIGEARGLGAPVHAPICGRVVAVEPRLHPSGLWIPAVVIENDGRDSFLPLDRSFLGDGGSPEEMNPEGIRRLAREAGLVGMGGGLFPSYVKLTPRDDPRPDFLILNGCECEPYLTCDHRLMVEETPTLLWGARAMKRALGVSRVVIAIEDNKPDAIALLRQMVRGLPGFEVRVLPSLYPQGAERTLVRTITGRVVPRRGLPADVGVVVHNVATASALGRALLTGEPLLQRIVTVDGDAVAEPANYWVPIGLPVRELLKAAGVDESALRQVILGGPMMGTAVADLDVPVLKGCGGVLAFTARASPVDEAGPCLRCGRCLDACPQGLAPFQLARLVAAGRLDQAVTWGLADCVECGSCAYSCPSRRPLVQYLRMGKAAWREHPRPAVRTTLPGTPPTGQLGAVSNGIPGAQPRALPDRGTSEPVNQEQEVIPQGAA